MLKKILCFFLVLFFTLPVFANNAKNYKVLDSQLADLVKVPAGKIMVIDFFSFGCPHCFSLNPTIQTWLKQNGSKVFVENNAKSSPAAGASIIFQPIPVAFESGWDIYSKAFFIAKYLGVESALHDKLFSIAQNPLLGLNSDAQLKSFFTQHGVDAQSFDRAAQDPQRSIELQNAQKLMMAFKVMEIPAMVIIKGKNVYYISNTTIPNADPKIFIATLSQLTQ